MCSEASKWVDICAVNHAVVSSLNTFLFLPWNMQRHSRLCLPESLNCITVLRSAEVTYILYISLIFRDLKLENILLGSDGHCKVADFGLAKLHCFTNDRTNSQCGTLLYMAPEVIIILNLKCYHLIFCLAVSVLC